jgi:hypothetical protein
MMLRRLRPIPLEFRKTLRAGVLTVCHVKRNLWKAVEIVDGFTLVT